MNLNQATQMLTWLDEERRRDKGELAKLQQRVESQAAEITEQARRIQELERAARGYIPQLALALSLSSSLRISSSTSESRLMRTQLLPMFAFGSRSLNCSAT